jgi:predicted aspartyl protease
MKMKALLDSGANAIYIDKAYAQKMKLPLTLLADPIPVYNVDGTRNAAGSITHVPRSLFSFRNTMRELPQK